MPIVNMLEAKTNLSRLVESVESGSVGEVVIARNGKPAARLVPIASRDTGRRLGLLEGQYADMSLEDFNALDAEVAKLFYGDDA